MDEYYGQTLERIRKQKRITIKDLVNGVMTPSTYHRFKNNEIDTSVSRFTILLDRLNIRYEEFMFIHHDYKRDQLKDSLLQLETIYNKKDVRQLERLHIQIKNEKWDNYLAQTHVVELIGLFIDKLLQKPYELEGNMLIQYLKKVETWTHYEIAMFSNCMKLLPTDVIDYFLNYVIRTFSSYQETNMYQNDVSRILINAIISFLSRKEVYLARKWFYRLENEQRTESLFFERFYYQLLKIYLEIAEGDGQNVDKIDSFKDYLTQLGCENMSRNVDNMNQWMIENYLGENED